MKKFLCMLLILSLTSSPILAMTAKQEEICYAVIHSSAAAAAGSAVVMSQLPGADNFALASIIGGMTISLAAIFKLSLEDAVSETVGVAVLSYFSKPIAARVASQWLLGWFPFLGNYLNAATMLGLVEWIGWDVAHAFDEMASAKDRVANIKTLLEILSKM